MGLFSRRADDGEVNAHMAVQAVKPQYVNAEAFTGTAARIAAAYLEAVYSQDIGRLPQNRAEEGLYRDTQSLIAADAERCRRTCQRVSVDAVQLSSEDIRQQFAVRSLTYDITYTVCGAFSVPAGGPFVPFEETRLGEFTFLNDSRLGWIISGHEDCGGRRT